MAGAELLPANGALSDLRHGRLVVGLDLSVVDVRVEIDAAAGETAAERRYYPWGAERYELAAVPTGRLYTGQVKDSSTGLYFYNARYYDPWLGRFISADTVVPGMANPQAFNRYSYVLNRPLLLVDPTGNYPEGQPDRPVPEGVVEDPGWRDRYRAWYAAQLRERQYQAAKAKAYNYYCANFGNPFAGSVTPGEAFGVIRGGEAHTGQDYPGSFAVLAPYAGTVTFAGSNNTAGMWKIRNYTTGEVKENSVWNGTRLRPEHRGPDGLYEPERLLATGEWEDIKSRWSHVDGTGMRVVHDIPGPGSLTTYYEHIADDATMVNQGAAVSQGTILGTSTNNGWSTGAHLHYGVKFAYMGRSEWLNPTCPSCP